MLGWVPGGHAIRVVIDTAERLMTRALIDRLVPLTDEGPRHARGHRQAPPGGTPNRHNPSQCFRPFFSNVLPGSPPVSS
jgi:hypothetical protein